MTRTKRLATAWYSDLGSEDDKNLRTQLVLGATPTLEILKRLLKRRLEALEDQTDFDSPAWQFHLAKSLGQKEELKDLIKLLTHIEE